jgi:hypothetical protein
MGKLERALFVVGSSGSGKSTQLRSMFSDHQFQTNSLIPHKKKLGESVKLRCDKKLYLRLTSPHESKEDMDTFLNKISAKIQVDFRWCFAAPLQLKSIGSMPNCVDTIKEFVSRFSPYRTRILFICPDRRGNWKGKNDLDVYISRLKIIESVEWAFIDAREREKNGLMLADFFDYS